MPPRRSVFSGATHRAVKLHHSPGLGAISCCCGTVTDLRLGQLERSGQLQALGDGQVLVALELALQGLDLRRGEGGAWPLLAVVQVPGGGPRLGARLGLVLGRGGGLRGDGRRRGRRGAQRRLPARVAVQGAAVAGRLCNRVTASSGPGWPAVAASRRRGQHPARAGRVEEKHGLPAQERNGWPGLARADKGDKALRAAGVRTDAPNVCLGKRRKRRARRHGI